MKEQLAEAIARDDHLFSHFGPQANLFAELEELFRGYGAGRRGQSAQVPARR